MQWLKNLTTPTKKPKYYNTRVKTPTVLQMDATGCGPAALGIILSYYGRIVSLSELRISCGVSRGGSNAFNLIKAAESYGMIGNGFKIEIDTLQEIEPPYIVFWNFGHFLVVEGFVGNRVYLNDPAGGPRSVTMQEFDESYTGLVLIIAPGPDFAKGGQNPSVISALYSRLKNSWSELLFSIIIGFLLVIPNLALAAISQVFIDNVLIQKHYEWLKPLLLGMGGLSFLQILMTLLRLRKLRYLNLRLSISMTGPFFWHILHLPLGFYAQRFAGEISTRIGINSKVAGVMSGQLARTAIDGVMIFFYGAVMLAYDWVLTLIGIIGVAVDIIFVWWMSRHWTDLSMRTSQDGGKLAGFEIGALQSIETIKAGALESDYFARWAGYYAKLATDQQEVSQNQQWVSLLQSLVSSLISMAVLVVGGIRVIDGHLTIGMLIAFQGLMGRFQGPVNTLVSLVTTIQTLNGDMKRLDDVLSYPLDPSSNQSTPTWSADCYRLQGYVELRNITFGYSRINAPLIENFSCRLEPGQRVAFVGSSGSGKSTLSKVITGLYAPWEGEILFDGLSRQQIPRPVMANSLAMVEQDIFLFGGTIRENLTLWDDTIPDEQLIRACQDAAILDVVMAIPGGLDGTLLEGGANLSGGQRQRLEIARALVYNPAILVMDEATSALDAQTEKRVDRNLRRRGCTCIIVAHRLSTIRDCDEIIVLERGKVVQRGTHESMKREDGIYARLIGMDLHTDRSA